MRKHMRLLYLSTCCLVVSALMSIPTEACASVCPNEALRSELRSGQLPDCRAYELVSPAYKEGAFISAAFAVSPEGSRFVAGSLGAFGGTEEDIPLGDGIAGVAYEFSRTASGWTASSLAPPASRYSSRGMFDASADLSGSLWELGTLESAQPEGVADLYLERPLGTFARIGPATPDPNRDNIRQYIYLGASADLSRVLFSVQPGFRWPFDATAGAGNTLYEYVGVQRPGETREPLLVGVRGDRGSTALISHCGTRLGSGALEEHLRGSAYNAISADGARVFFTAVGTDEAGCAGEAPPVGELFAREELPLASGELPAAKMRTVAISEPSKEDCEACLVGSGLKDAVFKGASEDGSRVFFTTEQELLPGATGENLYEYDFDAPPGERVTLVSTGSGTSEVQGVARVSEDGSHVYFVAKGDLTGAARNGVGNAAVAGGENLYVYERDENVPAGRTSFIATLTSPGDEANWQRIDARPVLASHDGSLLVFTSVADLTDEGLSGGGRQVFRYDAATGDLVRASIGQDGYNGDNRAAVAGSTIVNKLPAAYDYSVTDSPAAANGGQVAEDGAVFFESPDGLTPQALNDQPNPLGGLAENVYEYRAGSVYLLSDGRDASTVATNPGVSLVGSDRSGGDVFFYTSDSLIQQDGDTQQDIYDARVEGGLTPFATPHGCTGEGCRGPLIGTTVPVSGGSATQAAEVEAAPTVVPHAATKPKPKTADKRKAKRKRKAKTGRRARARHSANGTSLRAHAHAGNR
jgi:hypothetical protein